MGTQEHGHLSPDEVDAILLSRSALEDTRLAAEAISEAQQHLASCDICRSTVDVHAEQQTRFAELRGNPPAAHGMNCPQESEWPAIAGRLTEASAAEPLLRHAAQCDYCGQLLRQSLADFAEDTTAEEEVSLSQLQSGQASWRENMAAMLARSQPRRPAGISRRLPAARRVHIWALSGFLAVLACVGVLIETRWKSIDYLLVASYTQQRSLELRIPKAAWAPLRLLRGPANHSPQDRPPALLEGEAKIARELAQHPASAGWLQARGRADILDWNYVAAIANLERVRASQPDSPSLMTDLATAYFERAEAGNRLVDYSAAAELLSRALKIAPSDSVALFNRAIVYERMRLYNQAIEDWRRYLRVDPDSSWRSEARKRLADVEKFKGNAK